MGFFSFFFGDDEQLDQQQQQAAVAAAGQAARTLDIESAIQAHESWKQRLDDCLHGRTGEHLKVAQVCDDHACTLGQWIYSDGERLLGQYATFTQLRMSHQQFHQTASHVLELNQQGLRSEAEHMLHTDFDKLSHIVVKRLHDLKALR